MFSHHTKALKTESSVHFWALLGPFFILAATFVSAFRFLPVGAYFPFVVLLIFPVCWLGKKQAVFGLVGIFFAMFLYYYSKIPPEYRMWELGMVITVSLGLLITMLSLKEISQLVSEAVTDSSRRLEQFMQADASLKKTQNVSQVRLTELEAKVEQLEQQKKILDLELEEKRSELQANKQREADRLKSFELEKKEMQKAWEQKEKENEQGFLKERACLQKDKQEFHVFQLSANQKQIEMKKQLEDSQALLSELKKGVEALSEEKKEWSQQLAGVHKKHLDEMNEQRVAKYQLYLDKLALVRLNKAQKKEQGQAGALAAESVDYKSLYEQLREQFEQRGEALSEARQALFYAEQQNLCRQKEEEFAQHELPEDWPYLLRDLKKQSQENEHLKEEVRSMHDLLSSLFEKRQV